MTLDGVIQAMGGPDEDKSNNFLYGGWSAPYGDDVSGQVVRAELNQSVDYLLGRKTFEIWEAYWPQHGDFWPGINAGTKYVLSGSRDQSDWRNTVWLKDVSDIQRLKQTAGRDLQVWGSSKLVQLLLEHQLVDELRLKIFPLMLGHGKKLFGDGAMPTAFKLVDSVTTSTGVIIATYQQAGYIKTGLVRE